METEAYIGRLRKIQYCDNSTWRDSIRNFTCLIFFVEKRKISDLITVLQNLQVTARSEIDEQESSPENRLHSQEYPDNKWTNWNGDLLTD